MTRLADDSVHMALCNLTYNKLLMNLPHTIFAPIAQKIKILALQGQA